MNEIFNSYNLKSRVTNIIQSSSLFRESGGSAEIRERILDRLWTVIYNTAEKNVEGATLGAFLNIMREKYGVEVVSAEDSSNRYILCMPRGNWVVEALVPSEGLNGGFTIIRMVTENFQQNRPQGCKSSMYSRRSSADTAEFISRFDENLPFINQCIDDCLSECARNGMISNLVVSTAKGIVAQMMEEGVDIPKITCMRGTPERRVILYFEDGSMKLNCPLDYLRSRLYRRFVLKRL